MESIQPYTISVSDSKLRNLAQKLETTTLPDELDEAGWGYGAPLADIKRLTAYWKDSYDWRRHEAKINELPNFKTAIQVDGFESLDVHFIHQRSDVDGAIPLLFCHGCKYSPISCQTIQLTPFRAWQLPRSHQNPSSLNHRRQRCPSLPCRRPFSSQLRLLLRHHKERF